MPRAPLVACLLVLAPAGCQRACGASDVQVVNPPSVAVAAPTPPRVVDPAVEGWFSLARAEGDQVELYLSTTGFEVLPGDVPLVSGVQVGANVDDVNGVEIYEARLAIDPSRVSPAIARWLQQPVRIFAGSHLLCTANVTGFFAFNKALAGSDSFKGAKVTADDLRRILQQDGGPVMVARVRATEGSCAGAEWGRWASRPSATVLSASPDASVAEKTLAAFRRLPRYAELQKTFVAQVKEDSEPEELNDEGEVVRTPKKPPAATWDLYDGASPVVAIWPEAKLATVYAFSGGCGLGGELSALFDLSKADPWSSAEVLPLDGYAPQWMIDADGDGALEIFAGGVLYGRTAEGWNSVQAFPHPFVCGC